MSEQRQWQVDKDADGWRVFDLVTGTGLGPLSSEAGAQNLRAFCQLRTDFEAALEAEIERLNMSILPCKKCGHSFFAHREGWPRGCLDCPHTSRCHDFKGDDMTLNGTRI